MNPCPNKESQADDCLNPYALSKVTGEKLCKMYTDLFGLPTISFRYFNVYGERQPLRGQYAPVVGIFYKQKESGVPITIVGDGSQKRDFISVKDVVKANIIAASKDISKEYLGQVFNIGSGKNVSIKEIADLISSNQVFIENVQTQIDGNLIDMKSNYNYLWVLTDKYLYKINYNGLIIFKKENIIGLTKIGFYKNDILLSNESELYHLENNKELFTKIKLEKLFIKDFFVINETLYIYDKDHLNKYLILSN